MHINLHLFSTSRPTIAAGVAAQGDHEGIHRGPVIDPIDQIDVVKEKPVKGPHDGEGDHIGHPLEPAQPDI